MRKWRWPSWAPISNKPLVFVDVNHHFNHDADVVGVRVLGCADDVDVLSGVPGEFNKTFEERVGACLSADPTHRPRVLELKNDSLFQ